MQKIKDSSLLRKYRLRTMLQGAASVRLRICESPPNYLVLAEKATQRSRRRMKLEGSTQESALLADFNDKFFGQIFLTGVSVSLLLLVLALAVERGNEALAMVCAVVNLMLFPMVQIADRTIKE